MQTLSLLNKQLVNKDFAKGILKFSLFDKTKQISISLGKLINKINYDNLQEVKIVKVANGYVVRQRRLMS